MCADCGKGKLYGIGIGPGDPELLTVKALRILKEADIVYVPESDKSGTSRAIEIIGNLIDTGSDRIRKLYYPMSTDRKELESAWKESADRIAREVLSGLCVAYSTLGDPMLYSTYCYLLDCLKRHDPLVPHETIPGITSFTAAASLIDVPLVVGDERLLIMPLPEEGKVVANALYSYDTVVFMKLNNRLVEVKALLRALGYDETVYLVSRIGFPDERVYRGLSEIQDCESSYLSLLIVKRKKGRRE